ncbi:hypothetical protein ACND93_004908, partial [Escherichia coli]
EYLPGSLQGKISSDGCLKKEQMVVSAIASTPHLILMYAYISINYTFKTLTINNVYYYTILPIRKHVVSIRKKLQTLAAGPATER